MEDGEIIDDEVEDYTPLQRPTEMDNIPRPVAIVDESEPSAEEDSESEDSDDPQRGQKKQKLKPNKINNMSQPNAKAKKYNVWCSGIQEEVLTQELTNCEVAQRFERNRDVESYDYTRHRKEDELGESCTTNKRQYDDRQQQGVRARLGRRRHSSEGLKGSVRNILSLNTTVDSTDEEIARDIAKKLGEKKDELILRVVQVLGKEKAIEIFEKTKEIEESGGLLIMNQTRRRTAGGVFLYQVKSGNDQEMNQKIFIDDRRQYDAQKRTERSKIRRERAHRLQKELQAENLMGEPSRLRVAEPLSGEDEELGGGGVSNPPPSPVTDGRADSSPEPCPVVPLQAAVVQAAAATSDIPARTLTTYDDFLDLNASFEEMDNMDVF